MSNAILILTKVTEGTYMASAKIAKYLADRFNIPIIDQEGYVEDYNTIFFVNSMSPYCKFMDEVVEIIKRCKQIVWIMNDYTIYPPTQVRRYLYEYSKPIQRWSTVPLLPPRYMKRLTYGNLPAEAVYVNWNMLTYEPRDFRIPIFPGIAYYGAFREKRKKLFERYFEFPPYQVYISASKRAAEKFEDIDPTINIDPVQKDLLGWVQQFEASLYLEDSDSNDIYCSPANRFYECLAAGSPMFFDESSIWTFGQAGYDIKDFVVRNDQELNNALTYSELVRMKQSIWWRRDYRRELDDQVDKAYEQLS